MKNTQKFLKANFPNGELFITLFILWFAIGIGLAYIADLIPPLNQVLLNWDKYCRKFHFRGWDQPSDWPQLDAAFGILFILLAIIFIYFSFIKSKDDRDIR